MSLFDVSFAIGLSEIKFFSAVFSCSIVSVFFCCGTESLFESIISFSKKSSLNESSLYGARFLGENGFCDCIV